MRLHDLLGAAGLAEAGLVGNDPDVTSIAHDSREVRPGALFCCVRGARRDGHDFASEAVEAGAVALLVERVLPVRIAQVVVPSTRPAMARVADAFFVHPSTALKVLGVTGTNGKTTTVSLLASIFDAAHWSSGVIGTLTGTRTTPEAPQLQAELARLRDAGAVAVAMEVTSHGLALHRVDATSFAVGVFTNLSRDHLDFHGSVEAYFAAKASLFEPGRVAHAVLNVDDPHGRLLADTVAMPVTGFSLDDASELRVGARSSSFVWRDLSISLPLGGRFNVYNALAAATAAAVAGVEPAAIARGLGSVPAVPGRFEIVDAGQRFTVVVDYAHTPDSLDQVLRAARELAGGHRLLVVFGCGGDRDATKRPFMGEVASRLADVVVITSDNPRGEEPGAIISAVRRGVPAVASARVRTEVDRRAAIALAFEAAGDDDVVVIAGKGHETTQTFRDRVVAFDDRVVARELLGSRP